MITRTGRVRLLCSSIAVGAAILLGAIGERSYGGSVHGERSGPFSGAATNGLRVMVVFSSIAHSFGTPPICEIAIQNVTTNVLGVRLPDSEHRYRVELCDPNGQRVQIEPGAQLSSVKNVRRGLYRPNEATAIDNVSIPEVFQVHTNGLHTLVLSIWVSTNYPGWKDETYFLLPALTNTIDIPIESIIRKRGVSKPKM